MISSEQKTDPQSACLQRLVRPFHLSASDILVVAKRGGGEREIPSWKWWIDRRTPVGEDAKLFERMPHGGKRWLDFDRVVAVKRLVPNA
jgi:hypothetical protein